MRSRLLAPLLFGAFALVLGLVFWLGSGSNPAPDTAAVPKPTDAAVVVAKAANPPAAAPAAAEASAAPMTAIAPIATEEQRRSTESQRRAALPVFLKASDETVARLQHDIDSARAQGAAPAELAQKEAQLQQIQALRQQVLARNADVRSS